MEKTILDLFEAVLQESKCWDAMEKCGIKLSSISHDTLRGGNIAGVSTLPTQEEFSKINVDFKGAKRLRENLQTILATHGYTFFNPIFHNGQITFNVSFPGFSKLESKNGN